MRVSVVVPTYRRPDLLVRCLAALAAQDFDVGEYEIIVADDAGDAATERSIQQWARNMSCPLRYVAVRGAHGPAAARNAGAAVARGEILAFTDDDTVPAACWLRAGAAALTEGAAAAWGQIRMPLPERPTDYERNEAGLERAEFATANCFCYRAVFNQVGGFDERFRMAWREDADLFFTLLENGHRVVHVPEALVVHPVRPARWGISLSQQRKSLFNALLYKKHPRLYRERIQPMPPWHYYGITASALAAAVAALLGAAWLVVAAGAMWLLLTARFCWPRLRGTSHAPSHLTEMLVTSVLIPPLSIFWRLRGAVRFRVVFV